MPVRRIINHYIRLIKDRFVDKVSFLLFRKIKETGQLDRIIRAWISKPSVDCWGMSEFRSMGMEDTISAFVLIWVAVCLATFLFLVELTIGKLYSFLYRNVA